MAKPKKGRQTNNSNGKKRDTPPRLRQVREKRKEKEQESSEIDTTTLADDDPTPSIRSRVRGFLALMGDNSSDEGEDNEQSEDSEQNEGTPRKGDDKKRQRFAKEAEIIEVDQEEVSTSSINEPPAPTRLLKTMDTDSTSSSEKEVTVADILGAGPEEVIKLQQTLNTRKDCRYTCQIKVLPCENPMQFVVDKYTGLFKWLQSNVGKELSVATWDDAEEKQRIYSKPGQLPKATEISSWTTIWGTWMNIKPQQEGLAYLKLRFVTKSPDVLTSRLPEIGELRDTIAAATDVFIGRLPIPCQAVKVSCVGWLFGSNKNMNGEDLLKEMRRLINIPPHIRMGISWRAIKLENGRTPPWVDNVQPASALHIDMDWLYATVYKPMLANLFKKHGNIKPLGLTLRLIPCFSSDEGKNSTKDQRTSAVDMRENRSTFLRNT